MGDLKAKIYIENRFNDACKYLGTLEEDKTLRTRMREKITKEYNRRIKVCKTELNE